MRPWWLVVLAGCDGVFGLTHIPDRTDARTGDSAVVLDSSSLCTKEPFTDMSSVSMRWILVSSGTGFDTVVDGEQLVERVPANAAGSTYVRTQSMSDMTDATATVEVTRAIGLLASETYFLVEVDITNFYLFDVVNGQLTMRIRSMGVDKDIVMLNYNAAAHRYWRFQHQKALGRMLFFTSDDGVTYTMLHAINTEVPIGPMRFELGVAVGGAGLAVGSEASFDNFEYCPP